MNKKELNLTEKCHQPSIKLMKELWDKVPSLRSYRAIEVGCGDGRFSEDALVNKFEAVDLFDANPTAIKLVQKLKKRCPNIYWIDKARMEEYVWR